MFSSEECIIIPSSSLALASSSASDAKRDATGACYGRAEMIGAMKKKRKKSTDCEGAPFAD